MTQLPHQGNQPFYDFDEFDMDPIDTFLADNMEWMEQDPQWTGLDQPAWQVEPEYISPELEQWIQEQIADDFDPLSGNEALPDLGWTPDTVETTTDGTPGSTIPSPELSWPKFDDGADFNGNDNLEDLFPGIWPPLDPAAWLPEDLTMNPDQATTMPTDIPPVHVHVLSSCHSCDQKFPSGEALRTHNQRIHSRFNHCLVPGCGWSHETQKDLRRHALTHTEERRFVCPNNGCGRGFKRKDILQRHIRGRCRGRG